MTTLKERLSKIAIEQAVEYCLERPKDRIGTNTFAFHAGFNACAAELMPLLETAIEALEFYESMDNRVPGTSEWPIEITRDLDNLEKAVSEKVTVWNKPSKIETDCGNKAREALEKIK